MSHITVQIGQRYRRRRDGYTAVVKMVHRKDRLAEVRTADMLIVGERPQSVRFADLRDYWEVVS